MASLATNVLFAPNVADTALFASALEPGPIDPRLEALPEPRIVFTGAVSASKLDFDLIRGLAAARRDWTFALVGPVGLGDPRTDISSLAAERNIHLLGSRAYSRLPEMLRGAAVGLIPYKYTPLTASVFPMKLYEYLAGGLPVVATGLPSVEGMAEVSMVDGVAETTAAIDRAIRDDSIDRRRARSQAAAKHSWDSRLEQIDAALSRMHFRGE
jgi:glycosyltransferase involved in cell wall biosynthesis